MINHVFSRAICLASSLCTSFLYKPAPTMTAHHQ